MNQNNVKRKALLLIHESNLAWAYQIGITYLFFIGEKFNLKYKQNI